MNRLNTIANLRTIQSKVAELHCLVIDELTRLATEPDAENQPHGPKVPGFEDEVEWGPEAASAPASLGKSFRRPDTRDIGQVVRCCRNAGELASEAQEGVLLDIQQVPGSENLIYTVSTMIDKFLSLEGSRTFPFAWIEVAPQVAWDPDAPITLPIEIDVETAPEITHTAHVIVADGEVSVVAEPVEPAPEAAAPSPWPTRQELVEKALGPGWRILGDDEEAMDGDRCTADVRDPEVWIPFNGLMMALEWRQNGPFWEIVRKIEPAPEPEAPAAEEPKEEPQPEPVVEESEYREVTADDVGQVVEVRDSEYPAQAEWLESRLDAVLVCDYGRGVFVCKGKHSEKCYQWKYARIRVKKGS